MAAPRVRGGGGAAGPVTDIAEATTLDSVLFDDGLIVGPDLGHMYESITARIAAEVSVGSLLLSAKTDGELATAWEQIKQIAETPLVPPTSAPVTTTAGRPCFAYVSGIGCVYSPFADPNSPRQFAMQLLSVRDRLGERAAVAQAASSLAYPKIHKE